MSDEKNLPAVVEQVRTVEGVIDDSRRFRRSRNNGPFHTPNCRCVIIDDPIDLRDDKVDALAYALRNKMFDDITLMFRTGKVENKLHETHVPPRPFLNRHNIVIPKGRIVIGPSYEKPKSDE